MTNCCLFPSFDLGQWPAAMAFSVLVLCSTGVLILFVILVVRGIRNLIELTKTMMRVENLEQRMQDCLTKEILAKEIKDYKEEVRSCLTKQFESKITQNEETIKELTKRIDEFEQYQKKANLYQVVEFVQGIQTDKIDKEKLEVVLNLMRELGGIQKDKSEELADNIQS